MEGQASPGKRPIGSMEKVSAIIGAPIGLLAVVAAIAPAAHATAGRLGEGVLVCCCSWAAFPSC